MAFALDIASQIFSRILVKFLPLRSRRVCFRPAPRIVLDWRAFLWKMPLRRKSLELNSGSGALCGQLVALLTLLGDELID